MIIRSIFRPEASRGRLVPALTSSLVATVLASCSLPSRRSASARSTRSPSNCAAATRGYCASVASALRRRCSAVA